MEAVAAHAFRIQGLRDRIMIRSRAVVSVEGRIEAGNLRKLREICKNGADRREIVRLVQGRKRHIALEPREQLVVYRNRRVVLGAAMHDAVAYHAWRYALLLPQPCTG